MTTNVRLLDCTLRDGGYINEWNFGFPVIKDILKKLVASYVDYVEVGFLRNCDYSEDRPLYNSLEELARILPENRGSTRFVAMALHNTYDINKLSDNDGQTIEAVRVTFHDYDLAEGLEFCRQVITKGYKCFCNPINIMGYSDEKILDIIRQVNGIKPHAFSIVDTFGSMTKQDLIRIYSLLERNLDKEITIGLHLHENLSLSYSLAQDFTAMVNRNRDCVIDASLLGMGRVPGNLCMELIMDHVNTLNGNRYNINPLLDAIDDYIMPIKAAEPWGYSTPYALSAKYNLHRNYAEFLLGKGKLRAKEINQILSKVEDHKKTAFDAGYIDALYYEFQDRRIDDTETRREIARLLSGASLLILVPGATLNTHSAQINDYIEQMRPIILSANFVPTQYPTDITFFSNAKRFEMAISEVRDTKVLVTSNLSGIFDQGALMVNYHDLTFDHHGVSDNNVIMLLRLLRNLNFCDVSLAGFDGYINESDNYVEAHLSLHNEDAEVRNFEIVPFVRGLMQEMTLRFLTPSVYLGGSR
ncbi:aldolase catalytic domain-containing protein [Gorillibacterium sp. CAU 1737]|uniref:aldolase catalytic domain-containing protein n=1 Tax=Gorillibacterium sp. CAU 1737 TaxID=3140362 RepID=UPI003261758C